MSTLKLLAVIAFAALLVALSVAGAGWKWKRPGQAAQFERVAGWTWAERPMRGN
jgi:hypothetical protein